MFEQHQDSITKYFDISPILDITPVSGGFLSQNVVLHTADQRYFLKQYRFDTEKRVRSAHAAKHFFAEAGIPVILPIKHKAGETFFQRQQRFYSLFPYIDGRQLERGTFSNQALISTAQLQSQIHKVGQDMTLPHVQVGKLKVNYEKFVETVRLISAKIPAENRSHFDLLAAETLDLKLRLAEQHRETLTQLDAVGHPDIVSDHLVHGDYQDGNLFFNDDDQVQYVFDWEKAEVGSRGFQLARALEFICFSNSDNFKATYSAENFEKARLYLQTYHDVYPISRKELHSALQVRYLQKTMGLWVETEHYLKDNSRVDVFLEAEYHTLTYAATHLEQYAAQLSAGILR